MIGSTRGYFFDYLTRLGSAWIGWGRWFNRESCQKRWSECDNVFLRVRKRQLILYYAYTFHPHSLDPLTPPSSHCFPINSKAEINRDFTTSHFIGDGSSGAGRLSWLQKEEKNIQHTPDIRRVWRMMEWKMFFFFYFLLLPFNFYAPEYFHLTIFCCRCMNVSMAKRIGWVLIYHCLIISPLFSLSSRFKSISVCVWAPDPSVIAIWCFSLGFVLLPCTSCCRFFPAAAVIVVSLLFSRIAF